MTSLPIGIPDSTSSAGAEAKHRRLVDAAANLRSRDGLQADRVLHVAGSVLFPLGVLVILLGWVGTSSTTRLYEQIPYLVSGGVLGLGLIIGGGFSYFAYWITQLAKEGRDQSARALESADRTARTLERIEMLLETQEAAARQLSISQTYAPPAAPEPEIVEQPAPPARQVRRPRRAAKLRPSS